MTSAKRQVKFYDGRSNLLRIDDVPGEPASGRVPFASSGQAVRQGVHLQQTPAARLSSDAGVQDVARQAPDEGGAQEQIR